MKQLSSTSSFLMMLIGIFLIVTVFLTIITTSSTSHGHLFVDASDITNEINNDNYNNNNNNKNNNNIDNTVESNILLDQDQNKIKKSTDRNKEEEVAELDSVPPKQHEEEEEEENKINEVVEKEEEVAEDGDVYEEEEHNQLESDPSSIETSKDEEPIPNQHQEEEVEESNKDIDKEEHKDKEQQKQEEVEIKEEEQQPQNVEEKEKESKEVEEDKDEPKIEDKPNIELEKPITEPTPTKDTQFDNQKDETTTNSEEPNEDQPRQITNITTVIEEVHKQIERERLENELKERKAQLAEQLAQQQILTIADKDDEEEDQHNPIINESYPTTPLPKKPEDLPNQFNYASAECGATVLATNREARETSSILHSSKDRYMLNECASDQWFVIELCEEIGIQIIELANYEFFSSMFKTFAVYGSQQYPSSHWNNLGNFTANNVRKPQYFALNQKHWYKYIKIKFLTHYGNQVYCPISDIKVYGSTMVEDLKAGMENDINMQKIIEEQLHGKLHYPRGNGQGSNNGGSSSTASSQGDSSQTFESTAGMLKNLTEIFKKKQRQPEFHHHPPPHTNTEEEDPIAQITELYEQQSQKNPESIFKTLANRVKSLEINQSISNRYLEKLEAYYSETIQSIRDDFNRLSEFFEKMAYLGADLEKRIAREKEEVEIKIARDFSKEINYLRERIIKLEQKNEDDKNYYLMLLLATVVGTVFLSYMISKSNNGTLNSNVTPVGVFSQALEHTSPKYFSSLKHHRRNSLNLNQQQQQQQQNNVPSSNIEKESNTNLSSYSSYFSISQQKHPAQAAPPPQASLSMDVSLSSSAPILFNSSNNNVSENSSNNNNNNGNSWNRKKKKKNKQ